MSRINPFPDDAVEVVLARTENGGILKAAYLVDGKEIGYRFWSSNGLLNMEIGVKNGVMHGTFKRWYKNGQIQQDSTYIDGKEHGTTRQYSYDGALIGSYVMDFGTGVDLWFCSLGVLSEERYYLDGKRHGFERWWSCDNETIFMEFHFWNDLEHGIFRQWNAHDKLRRGFPQYYIMGKRVNKRQYMRACRNDPTLPPFVAEDNQPFRNLPREILDKQSE